MQTIEFHSDVRDGQITIPVRYRSKIKSRVKVILMQDEKSLPKNKRFSAMKLHTKGFTFNRDEANER